MKPANFVHLFVLILLLSFTANEHSAYMDRLEAKNYAQRVELSRLQRYSAKTEEGKARIKELKAQMAEKKNIAATNHRITTYKVLAILLLFLIALYQFMRYFKIDFKDPDDLLVAINYQRKTWLLAFAMFMVTSFWCFYFRLTEEWAAISYLAGVGCLVRSLMLATELRLITKKQGNKAFVFTTTITAVMLYFNLLIFGLMYYAYWLKSLDDVRNTIEEILSLL